MTNPAETPAPMIAHEVSGYPALLAVDIGKYVFCAERELIEPIVLACNSHARLTRERDELKAALEIIADWDKTRRQLVGEHPAGLLDVIDSITSRARSTLQSLKQADDAREPERTS